MRGALKCRGMSNWISKCRGFLLLVACSFALLLSAGERRSVYLLPHIALQGSGIMVNQELRSAGLIGYRVGLLGEWVFSEGVLGKLSLVTGMEVTRKGGVYDVHSSYPIVQSHAVEAPLLLSLTVHVTREVDCFLQGGAYAGYSFRNSLEHFPSSRWQEEQTLRQRPFFCPYDYGMRFGAGAEWRRWIWSIGTTLSRYDFYIDRYSGDTPYHLSHRTLFTSVGYRF